MSELLHLACTLDDLLIDTFSRGFINHKDLHFVIKQVARESNVDSSLDLISSQYPELGASLLDILDHNTDVLLKLVLDSSGSNELKSVLNLFCYLLNLLLSVHKCAQRVDILLVPLGVLLFVNLSLTNQQSSQTLVGILVKE